MNILFVCRYNRFRSRVAEALFNHYNKNDKINVRSAGVSATEIGYPMIEEAQEVLAKLNISFDARQGAQLINDYLIDWADRIYVVANDVSISNLPEEKTIQFDIPDDWHTPEKTIRTVKKIGEYIKRIVKELT